MMAMWPAMAGSAMALALSAEIPGENAISLGGAMAWSMVSVLERAREDYVSGDLPEGSTLDSSGTLLGSGAEWTSMVVDLNGRKFALAWPGDFDPDSGKFDDLPKSLAGLLAREAMSGEFRFSGAYRIFEGRQPKVGKISVPALPVEVASGTPVAGIMLP